MSLHAVRGWEDGQEMVNRDQSIWFKYNGIDIEVKPGTPEYKRLTKQADEMLELKLAGKRQELEASMSKLVRDGIKGLIEEWASSGEKGKEPNPDNDPRLVLSGWSLGIWFDATKNGVNEVKFVRPGLLTVRERAVRSDVGQPKQNGDSKES